MSDDWIMMINVLDHLHLLQRDVSCWHRLLHASPRETTNSICNLMWKHLSLSCDILTFVTSCNFKHYNEDFTILHEACAKLELVLLNVAQGHLKLIAAKTRCHNLSSKIKSQLTCKIVCGSGCKALFYSNWSIEKAFCVVLSNMLCCVQSFSSLII